MTAMDFLVLIVSAVVFVGRLALRMRELRRKRRAGMSEVAR